MYIPLRYIDLLINILRHPNPPKIDTILIFTKRIHTSQSQSHCNPQNYDYKVPFCFFQYFVIVNLWTRKDKIVHKLIEIFVVKFLLLFRLNCNCEVRKTLCVTQN